MWPQAHALTLLVSGNLLREPDKVTAHLLKGPCGLFISFQAKTHKARMWVRGRVVTPAEISGTCGQLSKGKGVDRGFFKYLQKARGSHFFQSSSPTLEKAWLWCLRPYLSVLCSDSFPALFFFPQRLILTQVLLVRKSPWLPEIQVCHPGT